MCSIMIFKKAR